MHEIGLCEALLDAVEKRAAGRQVTGLRVRIGSRHRVAEPALTQGFELIAAGSVADGAAIELVTVPGDEFVLESITVGEGHVPRDPG
ncbi:hydrogenase/urease maturation nickel metallochaperone HypA [Actinomadura scrupuli]|uniref:hydrogenase/urease maturation nickel metallochaperone HypA n=1 Tax=Actinomadura scrupuli TaxID=559629 RepID=UPI003D992E94